MNYNNFNDNLKLLKNKINNITICIYDIENGAKILENRQEIGKKIKEFILNKKKEHDIKNDGISIRLNNFYGCDITLEELKNRSNVNNNLFGTVKDFSKNVIPNFDNVIAVALCETKSEEFDNIDNKIGTKLIIVSKQIESVESINEKLDEILDYNLKSKIFSNIYVKSCKELLNDNQFEKRFDELNILENNLMAKDISNSVGINLKNRTITNVTIDSNLIPNTDYSFNLKKYTISDKKLVTVKNNNRFLVSNGDIVPLFTDPVHGIKIVKAKITKDLSFDMFLHNNDIEQNIHVNYLDTEDNINYNISKQLEEKIKKKCQKLGYNFSIDMINKNRQNHMKFSRNCNTELSLLFKQWICYF